MHLLERTSHEPAADDFPAGCPSSSWSLGIIQLVLDVVALVDLYRRPVERVALGNKWIWLAVILLINVLGAVLYLAVGRRPAPAVQAPPATTLPPTRTDSIVDSLYRRDDDPGTGPR